MWLLVYIKIMFLKSISKELKLAVNRALTDLYLFMIVFNFIQYHIIHLCHDLCSLSNANVHLSALCHVKNLLLENHKQKFCLLFHIQFQLRQKRIKTISNECEIINFDQ